MNSHKQILQFLFGLALLTLGMAGARAGLDPNDNYSSLVLSYQSSTFAKPICINADCHPGVSGPAVVFAHQLVPNFALGVSGSYLQSGAQTSSISSTTVSPFAEIVLGLGRRFDVGGSAAYLSTTLQLCSKITDVCTTFDNTGSDLGVFGKVFLTENRTLTLMLSYNAIALKQAPDQSVIALSLVTILGKHHRLALSVDRTRDSGGSTVADGASFGYSYLVY